MLKQKRNKKAQQEIAGFVLIVVLVVVALMVFLVISLRQPAIEVKSRTADNLLSSLMAYTTECEVSSPYQETIEDLIKSCYNSEKCDNLGIFACDYLNESLSFIMEDIAKIETSFDAYELEGYWESEDEQSRFPVFRVEGGIRYANASISGGGPELVPVSNDDGTIKVFLRIYTNND